MAENLWAAFVYKGKLVRYNVKKTNSTVINVVLNADYINARYIPDAFSKCDKIAVGHC